MGWGRVGKGLKRSSSARLTLHCSHIRSPENQSPFTVSTPRITQLSCSAGAYRHAELAPSGENADILDQM